jgi:hypothetical protein
LKNGPLALNFDSWHHVSMHKRSSKDVNQIAASIVQQIGDMSIEGKNPAAVALGRQGGLKGGPARAAKLTPKQRKRIAQKAAEARWKPKEAS